MSKKGFTTIQIIYLASIIALDFTSGMVMKNVLSATGILSVVRIDMIVPVFLMMLTRMVVDRFGTLIVYEATWGILSVIAMPTAFGMPGVVKIIPAISQGIIYDCIFSAFGRFKISRVYIAAIAGGMLAALVRMLIKVGMGMPWSSATKLLFGLEFASSIVIDALGAYLAVLVWQRIHETHLVKRLIYDRG